MASEAADQLREMVINRPTHVFVQAGVGSLADAVTTGLVETLMLDPITPSSRSSSAWTRRAPCSASPRKVTPIRISTVASSGRASIPLASRLTCPGGGVNRYRSANSQANPFA